MVTVDCRLRQCSVMYGQQRMMHFRTFTNIMKVSAPSPPGGSGVSCSTPGGKSVVRVSPLCGFFLSKKYKLYPFLVESVQRK